MVLPAKELNSMDTKINKKELRKEIELKRLIGASIKEPNQLLVDNANKIAALKAEKVRLKEIREKEKSARAVKRKHNKEFRELLKEISIFARESRTEHENIQALVTEMEYFTGRLEDLQKEYIDQVKDEA